MNKNRGVATLGEMLTLQAAILEDERFDDVNFDAELVSTGPIASGATPAIKVVRIDSNHKQTVLRLQPMKEKRFVLMVNKNGVKQHEYFDSTTPSFMTVLLFRIHQICGMPTDISTTRRLFSI